MKQAFISLAMCLIVALAPLSSFSVESPSNSEVMKTILQNVSNNPEIKNPDLIFPGQTVNYIFADGHQLTHVVKEGESQWLIVKDLIKQHGNVVVIQPGQTIPGGQVLVGESTRLDLVWAWIIGTLIALLILYGLYLWKTSNPETSGPPIVQDGVQEGDQRLIAENLLRTAQNEYTNRHPNAPSSDIQRIRIISPIERGKLYGRGMVNYADKPRFKRFTGEIGYRAMAEFPDGKRKHVHFLEFCGNDVTFSNRWIDNVRFVPEKQEVTVSEDIITQVHSQAATNDEPKGDVVNQPTLADVVQVTDYLMKGMQENGGDFTLNYQGMELKVKVNQKTEVKDADPYTTDGEKKKVEQEA